MDLINTFLNIAVTPIALIAIPFILPPYLFLQYIFSIWRSVSSEDVAGKVVLITGASSGIGEHLAYEYATRGARLALVARREYRLQLVAATAELIGSPDAIIIRGDVSKAEDCRRCIDATIEHFGRLDHLVANAGVSPVSMFEQVPNVTNYRPTMDINFWGSVYCSYYAIPYLKRSRGKIVAIASCAAWLPAPRMSFYNASKAALVSMYETLRVELGSEIGITIVTPGLVESEMTGGKFLNQQGQLKVDPEMRDVQVSVMPLESSSECAKAIVTAACRGDKYKTEPAWYQSVFYWMVLTPEIIEWSNRIFLMPRRGHPEGDTLSKKVIDIARQVKQLLTPSVNGAEFPELVSTLDNGGLLHQPY